MSIQAAGVGVASSLLRTSKMWNSARVTCLNSQCCVQRRGVVGEVQQLPAAIREVGKDTGGSYAHPGSVFMHLLTAAAKGRMLADVVVTPCRPRMSEVQSLKREICSGGSRERRRQRGLPRSERISVCWSSVCLKEVVVPESIAGRLLNGKHVLNDCAGHSVVFEESVKLQVAWKHQRKSSLLPQESEHRRLEA